MSDFDRVFEPAYTATDLFTNRSAENAAFEQALVGHRAGVLDGTVSLAREARDNVLTFYGIGGIGKTELSRRLERWVTGELGPADAWGEPAALDRPVTTLRADFHGSAVVDAGDLVLRLRAAAAARGRRFPAFDLGLATWWALAHPGEPLPDLRSPAGLDVRNQITDTLNDVLSDAGARFGLGPLTVRMGIRLVDAIRSHRLNERMLHECTPLAAIVDQARRDPSPYVAATLAGLLAWDIERLPADEKPNIVAFADALEYIHADGRAQERLFNRVVHLSPQVLWVVTSRTSLDWATPSSAAELPASGPRVWPGLRFEDGADSRQHLVGDLSDDDVLRYLAAASGVSGNPVLGPEVTERIRAGAHGLPLYLDLSLAIARAAPGWALDPADFGRSLPDLVTRVFADLPAAERDLARTASLVPRFDADLLAQASGGLLGDAIRFGDRPLVSKDAHAQFPCRLHDAVREAIADEPVHNSGAWAAADRSARAAELVEVLRRRHEAVLSDVERRREILGIAAGLCARQDLQPSWLLGALVDLPGLRQVGSLLPPPDKNTWIGQVSCFFEGWRGRPLRERTEYFSALAEEPLSPDVSAMVRRWLAFGLRDVGEYDRSLALLRQLLGEDPSSELLRYQIARTLWNCGRYIELGEQLESFPVTDQTSRIRLQSDLAFDRGDIDEAIAGARGRAAHLRSVGRHRVALENASMALWRSALASRVSAAECDTFIAEADRHGAWLNMRTGLAAKIVCLAGDEKSVQDLFAEVASVLRASSGRYGWREWAASLIHGLRAGDRQRIERTREQWIAAQDDWNPNRQVVDRLFVFAGYEPTYPPIHLGSAEEDAAADRRWTQILQDLVAAPPQTVAAESESE